MQTKFRPRKRIYQEQNQDLEPDLDQDQDWGLFVFLDDLLPQQQRQHYQTQQPTIQRSIQRSIQQPRQEQINYIYPIHEHEDYNTNESTTPPSETNYLYSCLVIGVSIFAIFI